MVERSFFWDGTATGDATLAPISAPTVLHGLMWTILFSKGGRDRFDDRGNEGHIEGYLNSLAPESDGSAVRIDKGAALVDGTFYLNDDTVSVAFPLPVTNPRIDLVVLRKNWADQTVRAARIVGTENASPTAPSLQQLVGFIWDIPIAQVTITTAGVVTMVDTRQRANTPLGGFGQMKLIERIEADGQSGEIFFDNIPRTYKSLYIAGTLRSTQALDTLGSDLGLAHVFLNEDAQSNNYNRNGFRLSPAGPTVIANASVGDSESIVGLDDASAANYWTMFELELPNYMSDDFKVVIYNGVIFVQNTTAEMRHRHRGSVWLNTDEVTSIWLSLTHLSGVFVAGSTVSLYGRL